MKKVIDQIEQVQVEQADDADTLPVAVVNVEADGSTEKKVTPAREI